MHRDVIRDIIDLDGFESDSDPEPLEGEVIERTYHVDLDFVGEFDEMVTTQAENLATGILVTWDLIVPVWIGDQRVADTATVRFYGPRNQLIELERRYRGIFQIGRAHV